MASIHLYSEIGDLEGVILHPPGPEVENMTPQHAERALYSDILNLAVARREYSQLESLLQKFTESFRVTDLLKDVLRSSQIREKIIKRTCYNEGHPELIDTLLDLDDSVLAKRLIQGVPLNRDTLTGFLSNVNFSLRPLHNFLFTRDSSVAIHDRVLIAKMANRIRDRESLIMQAIFDYHPNFRVPTINPGEREKSGDHISVEGGDILVAREDITLIGLGSRTTSRGIDFIVDQMKEQKKPHHILVQELPHSPESFIHLDMVFTFLDRNSCLLYEPLILASNKYQTVRIDIDNGKVKSIKITENLLTALKDLGMELEPSYCGGNEDTIVQEREQWHSGANLFAIGPGKLIGYNRNVHTLENLDHSGYRIIPARDILNGEKKVEELNRFVITIDGAELSRGGGGVRCMTMPFRRKSL